MKDYSSVLIKKLKSFKKGDIKISHHAMIRIRQRQLNINEIKENIINPKRLKYAIRQHSRKEGE